MAILKERLNRRNELGAYDAVHLETSSDIVVCSDGTSLENKLSGMNDEISKKAPINHGVHSSFTSEPPKEPGEATPGVADTVSRSDHVHPAQTTVTGNAGTATKLQTARNMQVDLTKSEPGQFNGSEDVTLGVTGVLGISNGGTGKSTAPEGLYALINGSNTDTGAADEDYIHVADVSASTAKKISISNLKNILGGGMNDDLPPLLDNFTANTDVELGVVQLLADMIVESRAQHLFGAIWVYNNDHIPETPDDGERLELSRDDMVSESTPTVNKVTRTIVWDLSQNFYARQFTYNSKKQYQTMLEGAVVMVDAGTPNQVTDFVVSGSGASPVLTLVNPVGDAKYYETVVIQKEGTPPTSPTDGIEIYRGTGETTTASGLQPHIEYYFAVFTLNDLGLTRGGVVSEVYQFDFPDEPTEWSEITTLNDSSEWSAPETGWFKFVFAAKCGDGGADAGSFTDRPFERDRWFGLSAGSGGTGGYAETKIALSSNELVEIIFSDGSVSCRDVNVTAGKNGSNTLRQYATNAPGGEGGTAEGGNIKNVNGLKGNDGKNTSYVYGELGYESITLPITQGVNRIEDGAISGNGQGVNNNGIGYGNTVGTSAYVKIYRGNTNTPSPSQASVMSLVPTSNTIDVSWENSGDPVQTGTTLVYNSNHAPNSPTDGTVVDIPTDDKQQTYSITGLANDKPTYIALYPYDENGKYGVPKTDVEIPRETTWYDEQETLTLQLYQTSVDAAYEKILLETEIKELKENMNTETNTEEV